jgi:predicted ATPase
LKSISGSFDLKRLGVRLKSEDGDEYAGPEFCLVKDLVRGNEELVLGRLGKVLIDRDPEWAFGSSGSPLSSGQIAFLKIAAQLCLHVEHGSVVLIDEPETHMHPNFISEFVKILDSILEMTGSFSIIATHSAYFVREVPNSQVHILTENQKFIQIDRPRLKNLGCSVGAISFFIFQENSLAYLAEKAIEAILKVNSKEREVVLSQLAESFSSEAMIYLKSIMDNEKK